MTPGEVFFETVIESLRSLECELIAKAEVYEAKSDGADPRATWKHEYDSAAHTYRECVMQISNRRDRFSSLYERLQHEPHQAPFQFARELSQLLNRHCAENASNTPDFILAEYLLTCLNAWNTAASAREKWYGGRPVPADPPPMPRVGPLDNWVQEVTRRACEKLDAEAAEPPRMDTEHARNLPENEGIADPRDTLDNKDRLK